MSTYWRLVFVNTELRRVRPFVTMMRDGIEKGLVIDCEMGEGHIDGLAGRWPHVRPSRANYYVPERNIVFRLPEQTTALFFELCTVFGPPP